MSNSIEFITIASTGNATDFGGDLTVARRGGHSASSSTRGVFAGGFDNSDRVNTIDYMTIASTGTNAIDFGDLIQKGMDGSGYTVSSPTRGVFAGGDTPGAKVNLIQFITISTLGNAADFGDLNELRGSVAGASNATRGVFMGGFKPAAQSTIDYITISTLGNATNFGDLSTANYYNAGSASATRAISGGGGSPFTNTIEYIEIPTTGNAVDFGDLTQKRRHLEACSNGHGGL